MILGIDIGIAGGIAVLSASGELIEVHAMPCLADGHAGRRAVNGPLLASIVFASHATRAFVEHVSARPGEGAVGAFSFGRSRGRHRRRFGRRRRSLPILDARMLEANRRLAARPRQGRIARRRDSALARPRGIVLAKER